MRKKLGKYLYKRGTVGNQFFKFFMNIINAIRYNKFTDTAFTKSTFEKKLGYPLNLKKPITFDEKLQWLKLNAMGELETICSDKYLVRGFVEKEVGIKYLIPLIFKTYNIDDISVNVIPEYPVIIKTNHASQQVFIIRNKYEADFDKIKESLRYQLRNNFYHGHREPQYKNIEPRVIVEKLLQNEEGEIPKDYKFHCFNGTPRFVHVDSEKSTGHKQNFYDSDWNHLAMSKEKPIGEIEPKPECFEEMLYLATKLSSNFIFVRVDLYLVKGGIYFGELTFTPTAGLGRFDSIETDVEWGKHIIL